MTLEIKKGTAEESSESSSPSREDYDRLNQDLQALEKRVTKNIEEKQFRSTELLAIFVALFTFISIEFQIFQNDLISSGMLLALSLLIVGCLILFILLIDITLKHETKIDIKWFLLFGASIAFIIIAIFSFKAENSNLSRQLDLLQSSQQEFIEIKECFYKNGLLYKCIQQLDN